MAESLRQNSAASSHDTVSTGWRLVSAPAIRAARVFLSAFCCGDSGAPETGAAAAAETLLGLFPMTRWYSPCVTSCTPR